ncbi:hypothetical protein FAES_3740 [Fibrella aestuarina BUZ 2]|uniref:Uncharacterized protein n=1 Tax=Fibrella aestuarina BUZ 2 TaxID=1166018 RepID=I0KC94_9BACT|nr:Uma2 family endonuclease [Fibrella aestuarina]CCH01747.1 hypothetical protein FAES_3740 [Fibrella aestuarina BUZ 2]
MEPTTQFRLLTYPDYETLEQQSDIRYEFDAGQVYAMAGGTFNHNELVVNTMLALRDQRKI